ncbi:MAG TPA: PEGA domain-containing protein [Pyrinomonadaceae bacterium]
MRTLISLCLALCLLIVLVPNFVIAHQGQSGTPGDKRSADILLPEDTPVRLKLMQNLSSGTSKLNDKVDFEVIEAVKVGDAIVIEQGATAIATVTQASSKKSFGRSGKLNVNIDYVRLTNGEKANLRAVKGGSGGSRTGVMTGAVVATAIIFFPAAPLFFFVKGKNIEIPKGTEITAYIAADTRLALSTPAASETAAQVPATEPVAAPSASTPSTTTVASSVLIKSDPIGAEITIGEKFVGTTPSTLKLTPGEHTIVISKSGYKEWKRTVTLNSGSEITLDASLEKLP